MKRTYRAARREADREPVDLPITYEVQVPHPDAPELMVWEERTEVFRCRGEISSLTISELGYHADLDTQSAEGAALLRDIFSQAFGDDVEYKRFYAFTKTQRIDDDLLIEIMQDLIEEFTGRPTQRPSDSQRLPSTDGLPSKVVSLPGGFSTSATPLASSS